MKFKLYSKLFGGFSKIKINIYSHDFNLMLTNNNKNDENIKNKINK